MPGEPTGRAAASPRRQRRRERNRAQLLAAAREQFGARGFVATTINHITEAADVAHGTFYSYFATKDEAFSEIIDTLLDDLFHTVSQPAEQPAGVRRRLDLAITAFLRQCRRERAILSALHQASQIHPEYSSRWDSFRQRLQSQVENDLSALSRLRHIPQHVRVDLVSVIVTRMIEGVALHVISAETVDVEAIAHTTANVYFDAVFRPSPVSDDEILPLPPGQ